jgi:3-oxoadipate enol-lactonase
MRSRNGLHYFLDGPADAPVLMLSHAIGTNAAMWAPQLPALSRDYRVLLYDTRGHGSSDTPEGPYTLADLGGDVLGLLDELGLARVHFGGLSLGGITGLWLGLHAPDRLASLMVANAAPRIASPEVWQGRIGQVEAEGMRAIAAASPPRWFTSTFIGAAPATAVGIQSMVAGTPRTGYAGCCAALRDADLWAELGEWRVPTLVIAGQFDPVTTVREAHAMAACLPDARVAALPASHLANIEAAGDFNREVLAFLAAQAPPRVNPGAASAP